MTQFASIALQTLNYTRARDGKGNSNPYIWPALLPIDNGVVGLTSPPVALAEVVIANGMHQGDTASIPLSAGHLITQIGDSGNFQGLIIVVVLGRLNLDTTVGSDFQSFQTLNATGPTPITLDIKPEQGTPGDEYKIAGNLQLFPTEITFPQFLNFGKLPVGQPSNIPVPLRITNVGTGAATVSIPPSPPPQHAPFWWTGSGNHTINPGASLTLHATFKPTAAQHFEFQLRFTSNAVGSPHVVDLRGDGIDTPPQ